jgi:hypothetical protein
MSRPALAADLADLIGREVVPALERALRELEKGAVRPMVRKLDAERRAPARLAEGESRRAGDIPSREPGAEP